MSWRLLEQFVTVAEEQHFTRAAQRLSMSQPPLTQAIHRLERTLGVQLLERSTRQVRLTAAGRAFALDARHLLDAQTVHLRSRSAHRARNRGRAAHRVHRRRGPSRGTQADRHPSPQLARRSRPPLPAHVGRACGHGAQSAAGPSARAGAVGTIPPTWRLSFDTRRAPGVRTAERPRTGRSTSASSLTELRDERFALPSPTRLPAIADMVRSYCGTGGFEPRDGGHADTVSGMLSLVAAGCGVCLVPHEFADGPLAGVTYRPLSPAPPLLQTLVIRPAAGHDPLVDRLLRLLVQQRMTTEGLHARQLRHQRDHIEAVTDLDCTDARASASKLTLALKHLTS